MGTVKATLYLGVSMNLCMYFPHLLSDLGEIGYKDLNIMLFSICVIKISTKKPKYCL